MKTYIKIVIGAILIGSLFAFFFYKDINKEVSAVKNNDNKIYLYQVGVYKSLENAINKQLSYNKSVIYKDDDLYRVIIGVSTNKENFSKYLTSLGYTYYIKELISDASLIIELKKYESLINNQTDAKVIEKVIGNMLDLFMT